MASVSPPPYTQWLKWPGDDWERITPKQAGLDEAGFAAALAATPVEAAGWGGTAPAPHEYGAALTRGGYLVHTWGDPEFKTPSASLGKCMTRALVGITAEVFDEQPYTYSVLTLNGAQALLVNERGHGLVTVNAAGQGRVIVGAADYWMTDRLNYAAPELVNMEHLTRC